MFPAASQKSSFKQSELEANLLRNCHRDLYLSQISQLLLLLYDNCTKLTYFRLTAGVPPTADQQELRVETWFTDHARLQRCHIPRLVQLGPDFRTWEQQIRLEWIDHIDLRSEVEFYVVHPIPEDKDPTAVAQLILVQHADMRQSSIVLSIYDRAYDGGRPHSHAVVTADRVSLQSLISQLQNSVNTVRLKLH